MCSQLFDFDTNVRSALLRIWRFVQVRPSSFRSLCFCTLWLSMRALCGLLTDSRARVGAQETKRRTSAQLILSTW